LLVPDWRAILLLAAGLLPGVVATSRRSPVPGPAPTPSDAPAAEPRSG
jgi:hypothetical protein